MEPEHPDSPACEALWHQARALYAQGRTARQIAYTLGLSAAAISTRATDEHWPELAPPDWYGIRDAWEAGKSVRILASQYGISASTLRKRRVRERWCRSTARPIDALRFAVRTLEEALKHTDVSDTMAMCRLAAALSMAAGRLRDADLNIPDTHDSTFVDPQSDDEIIREQMTEILVRLSGEGSIGNTAKKPAPNQPS